MRLFIPFVLLGALVGFYFYFTYAKRSFVQPNIKALSECFDGSEKNVVFTYVDDPNAFDGYQKQLKNDQTGSSEIFAKSHTVISNGILKITFYVNRDFIVDPDVSGYERSLSTFMKEEFAAGKVPGFNNSHCEDTLIKIHL